MSKKAVRKQEQGDRSVDNTRGSLLWSYNHFRMRILTSLLNDLYKQRESGIDEPTCRKITDMLQYSINFATEIESGGVLTSPIYLDFEEFTDSYKKWNKIKGISEDKTDDRDKAVKDLRKKRQSITDKSRKIQYELDNNLDQALLSASYQAISDLITFAPSLFKNLGEAFKDFMKRGGQL